MLRKILFAGAAVGALGMVTATAHAGAISEGIWYAGTFQSTGSALAGGGTPGTSPAGVSAPSAPWTITLTKPAQLLVVDVEASGDQFALTDNGGTLGNTSTPTTGFNVGECISCALANPAFSQGSFFLGVGSHSIAGTFLGSIGFGDFDFIVNPIISPVPEPASMALLGVGLLGLGFSVRSRRKSA